MNQKYLLSIIAVLLMLNLLATGLLFLRGSGTGTMKKGHALPDPIERDLGMSDEQIQTHRNLIRDHRAKERPVEDKIRELRQSLHIHRDLDQTQIDSITALIALELVNKEKMLLTHLQRVSEMLTVEQRETFHSLTIRALGERTTHNPPLHKPGNHPPPKR